MGRKLPPPIERLDDETDEDFVQRKALSKRRLQTFKRLFRQYYQWRSLRDAGQVDDILTIEGEDFYLGDLLTGIDTLPPQQRKAFELICIFGYTESAATEIVLPNSSSSTPVQQYSDDGLKKMVMAYDAKQAGTWDPSAVRKRRPAKRRNGVSVATASKETIRVTSDEDPSPDSSTVKTKTRKPVRRRRKQQWNWNDTSDEHRSFADYINEKTDLGITPSQVKAASFLRKEWYHSDEAVSAREQRRAEREAEEARLAAETPEQRKARQAASRTERKARRAQEKLEAMNAEIRQLRREAGLDPETGQPVAQ
ncbi:hypothetical protein SEA_PUPPER_159 [Gordonia phage Pupper]|uniref:Uncharacterized protein n=1 Tax=Gordonia phage Pupper TaxID=2571249 RepID=A0A4Y6EKS7_9CAUD|nr:hypothetical protein KHQ83_gp118 [Gordonia phage Pupper]QDF18645.1 hypothetical protein SEA_PUPPER_159 [Gordonia phage Pupper]QDF18877.1 hypothetical protein SEA_SCENTAE_158 [Gordonia phage SCentae]